MADKRIVVLGGGNGTSRLLGALKPLLDKDEIVSLHALVLNADDGGSTGRLRSQYGVAAMGDLTRCLMALSNFRGDTRGEQFLKALDYRFEGGDFGGHTLRNVFLASLEKTSNLDAALAMMARTLQVPQASGVLPTTTQALTQQVVVEVEGNGEELLGEGQHFISHKVNLQADPRWSPGMVRVKYAEGDVPLNPRAAEVLAEATHVVIAPGHTYGTILPTLALPELGKAVAASRAKLMIVMTLLTTPRQTTGWTGEDFVRVYMSYLGDKRVEVVIANKPPGAGQAGHDAQLVKGQGWVKFNGGDGKYGLIEEELVSMEKPVQLSQDNVPRAIVVHDAGRLREVFRGILM